MARLYRMTISSIWYDPTQGAAREWELHYKVARGDDIQYEREYLAKRGIEYYQWHVYYKTGRWIPKRKIKVWFEREESVLVPEEMIDIESRSMEYVGRHWTAQPLPSRRIGYAKRKYTRRIRG